jgi:hypothetical protein
MSLRALTPALFVLGVVLMVPFETTVTLVLGVGCLLAFIVCGTFLVASPEFLADEEDRGG